MAIITKTYAEVKESKENYIDVYKPIAGWKAKLMFWDEELGMFDCWNTGWFAYATKEEAILSAKDWAEAEEIPYVE
jgi:hypothetical protein